MIDFVKLRITSPGLKERLLADNNLKFNIERGKMRSDVYMNFVFILYESGSIEARGSLHKYSNFGMHNWNDFTRLDLWDSVTNFCEWLKISPQEALLHNLEFGANLLLPFPPKELLKNLVAYKKEPFHKVSLRSAGTYHQAKSSDYYIKCYDKGKQNKLSYHLLRFEIKVTVMRFFKDIGIKSLLDLQQPSKLILLGEKIVLSWNELLIREDLSQCDLSSKERATEKIASTPSLYQDLSRRKRYEIRKSYGQLVSRCSNNNKLMINKKELVRELLISKWKNLIQSDVCDDMQVVFGVHKKGRLQPSSIFSKCTDTMISESKNTATHTSIVYSEEAVKDNLNKHRTKTQKRRTAQQATTILYRFTENGANGKRKNLQRKIERILRPSSYLKQSSLYITDRQQLPK